MDNDFKTILKERNLSITSVRLMVLQALQENPHSDATGIFEAVRGKLPAISMQAVYNNLHALAVHGIVREIKPKGHVSLYETRAGDNHHHIVCRQCGHVADTDCVEGCAPCLTPTDDQGFKIDEAEVIFWGICPACQNKQN